ncbi:MAG: hypothetical protein MPW15_15750 [Candidatus Manganitrophus sp.]|nr:hypothetical protein [Candidatus Manganitrophus sp.]
MADTDGIYRVELRVVEEVDLNVPEGAPIADTGATSEPDEVIVIAGHPGPFEKAGNKLILDGSRFALSTTVLDIGDPEDIGDKRTLPPNTQLNELTAEGWFWVGETPAPGSGGAADGEAAISLKMVLNASNAGLLLRMTTRDAQTVTLGPVPLSLGQWHHIAAVVAGRSQPRRVYLAVDGRLRSPPLILPGCSIITPTGLRSAAAREKRFWSAWPMKFESRRTPVILKGALIRRRSLSFRTPLLWRGPGLPSMGFGTSTNLQGPISSPTSPSGAMTSSSSERSAFSPSVGSIFRGGSIPSQHSTDGSLWIAGGLDDGARTVSETEQILTNDQLGNLAPLNIVKVSNEDTIRRRDDGIQCPLIRSRPSILTSIISDPGPDPTPGVIADDRRVVVTAGKLTATDNGLGGWTGAVASGTINYQTGEIRFDL